MHMRIGWTLMLTPLVVARSAERSHSIESGGWIEMPHGDLGARDPDRHCLEGQTISDDGDHKRPYRGWEAHRFQLLSYRSRTRATTHKTVARVRTIV